MLAELLPNSEIRGENIAIETRARGAVKLRHQLSRLRDINPADNPVEPFAAADRARRTARIVLDRAREACGVG